MSLLSTGPSRGAGGGQATGRREEFLGRRADGEQVNEAQEQKVGPSSVE